MILTLPYPPAGTTGNHAVKHGGGNHYLTKAALHYRASIAQAVALQNARRGLEGPLEVVWTLYPPDLRARDSGNVLKSLADNLTKAGVWVDDSNKVIRREVIEWGEVCKGGKVELKILAYGDENIA